MSQGFQREKYVLETSDIVFFVVKGKVVLVLKLSTTP
jgi:hypothetical protein